MADKKEHRCVVFERSGLDPIIEGIAYAANRYLKRGKFLYIDGTDGNTTQLLRSIGINPDKLCPVNAGKFIDSMVFDTFCNEQTTVESLTSTSDGMVCNSDDDRFKFIFLDYMSTWRGPDQANLKDAFMRRKMKTSPYVAFGQLLEYYCMTGTFIMINVCSRDRNLQKYEAESVDEMVWRDIDDLLEKHGYQTCGERRTVSYMGRKAAIKIPSNAYVEKVRRLRRIALSCYAADAGNMHLFWFMIEKKTVSCKRKRV
ncbi:hypothetical protein EBS67_15470 [bacterium]|nr:hypothetical protein [bacterium]